MSVEPPVSPHPRPRRSPLVIAITIGACVGVLIAAGFGVLNVMPISTAEYEKAGIQDALLAIPDLTRDEILKHLDKIAPLAKAHAA